MVSDIESPYIILEYVQDSNGSCSTAWNVPSGSRMTAGDGEVHLPFEYCPPNAYLYTPLPVKHAKPPDDTADEQMFMLNVINNDIAINMIKTGS